VGLANSVMSGKGLGSGVNWSKALEVGLSLLISPLLGFALAAILLTLIKKFVKAPELYEPPQGDQPPPGWIRGTLLLTCTGVSLAHGSNDGQKGIGLIMLILIGVVPAHYALDPREQPKTVTRIIAATDESRGLIEKYTPKDVRDKKLAELSGLREQLAGKTKLSEVPEAERWGLRANLIRVDTALADLEKKQGRLLSADERGRVAHSRGAFRSAIYYAPDWVLIAVATALGSGTMIGWKRIVVTVGEKIGKTHLTYAQGAAAELVAMTTIGLADYGGLPVSTTQVLSSGVAGTMAANGTGLQWSTVRNIAIAWVLTLPVCLTLSAVLYVLFRWISS
jgi:PiT family inorganic phosphate transporter